MSESLKKFQELLRELFQFDCADLDFGIYRIMNYKRDVIEKFIADDLPRSVKDELDRGALADQSHSAHELEKTAEQVKATLGSDALDGDGNLLKYQETELSRKYQALKTKAEGVRDQKSLEISIFNHLYTFFSRYYQDGDFISKRRYSRKNRYAIPYNGEEVYLYWANSDQYYVKTAEHLQDYEFKYKDVKVHFRLKTADLEQDNVKGDKRYFMPISDETAWDADSRRIVIPVVYRPLKKDEEIKYGKKNIQEKIINESAEEIPKRLSTRTEGDALAALIAEKRKTDKGEAVTNLEHHLRQYTRKNTSDFFIHKDLKGFLTRELDFYLKNEVLNLDEMEAAGEERTEGWFQLMRIIKNIGADIIEFLHQIEEFQKMLWEKRKFVVETQYCVRVSLIAEELYFYIAGNEQQWIEWEQMCNYEEKPKHNIDSIEVQRSQRIRFIKDNPTLLLDTRYFDKDFLDKLFNSIVNLNAITDGTLIQGENWQSINLLVENYRKKIKCIYIDPPYNTGSDGFPYKDSYKHASWVGMIHDRILMMKKLMTHNALFFLSTDEHEASITPMLLNYIFGAENRLEILIWKKSYGGGSKAKHVVNLHEYVWAYANDLDVLEQIELSPDEKVIDRYYKYRDSKFKERGPYRLQPLATTSMDKRPNLRYPIHYKGKKIWPHKQWQWSEKRTLSAINNDEIIFKEKGDGNISVNYKQYLKSEDGEVRGAKVYSIIDGIYTQQGTGELRNILGELTHYKFPKPTELIKILCECCTEGSDIIIDAFAGSGSTGHSVIKLNQISGGNRKFILIEISSYFDTDLVPRLKRVTLTPEWKDGRPKRMATKEEAERSPRIIKYMRLESYEDALNNIEFDDGTGQKALKFDDYLLKYMLKWETRSSKTLLNTEKLSKPFDYKMKIHRDGETRERKIDIPETFNYLLGLHVETRRVHYDEDRRYLVYRGRVDSRKVAVIWRDTEGWEKKELERDKKFVEKNKLTEGIDEVFVNGDSFISEARALEPLFKSRMFAEVPS